MKKEILEVNQYALGKLLYISRKGRKLKVNLNQCLNFEATLFIHRKLSSGTSTPSSASTATVTSGELRRALNLASAENVATNGSGSPVRSPKPSCSSSGSKQIGQQTPTTGQKLMQIASV